MQDHEKSHIVEVVIGRFDSDYEIQKTVERLEDAYTRIYRRAEEQKMILVSVLQTCEKLTNWTVVYTLTANWISQADLERWQHRQMLMGMNQRRSNHA